MQIAWQAEIGLAEIDERIAEADRNISQLGSLIPELATTGYSTTDIEDDLALMRTALHHLRAQRRTIVETLDGNEPPPGDGSSSAPNHQNYDFGFRPDRARRYLAGDICMAESVVSPYSTYPLREPTMGVE